MVDVRTDMRVLSIYVGKRLPALAAHLRLLNVDIAVVCLPWFLCLYVDVLPPESAFRVWDVMLAEGNTAVLSASRWLFYTRPHRTCWHCRRPARSLSTSPGFLDARSTATHCSPPRTRRPVI